MGTLQAWRRLHEESRTDAGILECRGRSLAVLRSAASSTESQFNDVHHVARLDGGEATMRFGRVESHVGRGETYARLNHARDVWPERFGQKGRQPHDRHRDVSHLGGAA